MPFDKARIRQILHVPVLRIHHHYVTYCCPYVVNVILLTCQESNTKVFVILTQKKKTQRKTVFNVPTNVTIIIQYYTT